MALEDRKTPYELLVRFNPDGSVRGAHAQFMRRVTLDGELLKEEIGAAEPLDTADLATSALMSDIARQALADVSRLTDQVAALEAALQAALAEARAAAEARASVAQQLGEARMQIETMKLAQLNPTGDAA